MLEVRYGEVLVEFEGALIAFNLCQYCQYARARRGVGDGGSYCLLVLAEGGIDDAHVEQDLGGIRDVAERLERLVELIVVVELQGLDPCLDFLLRARVSQSLCLGCFARVSIEVESARGSSHLF